MELFLKTFSKTALLLGTLVFSITAQAVYEGNWLFGVSAGSVARQGTIDIKFHGNASLSGGDIGFSQHGFIWGVLTGYQARCAGVLIGAELHIDWDRAQQEINDRFIDNNFAFDTTVRLRRHVAVGLTTRVGMEVLPELFDYATVFLPYIRLGVETSKDHVDLWINDDDSPLHVDSEGSRRDWRFIVGAGVEAPIPYIMGLSVRAEYNYLPNSRSIETFGPTLDLSAIVTSRTRSDTHVVKAVFVWNFV